jgi:hypothetical protein
MEKKYFFFEGWERGENYCACIFGGGGVGGWGDIMHQNSSCSAPCALNLSKLNDKFIKRQLVKSPLFYLQLAKMISFFAKILFFLVWKKHIKIYLQS